MGDRKVISDNLIYVKIFFGIVFFTSLYPLQGFISQYFRGYPNQLTPIFILLSVEIGSILVFLWTLQLKRLAIDSDNLFIAEKKGEKVIPIKNISAIKITQFSVSGGSMWKIKYTENNGKNDFVRFFPNHNFVALKEIIKAKNANTKIKNWTYSFDFDI